MAWPIRPPSCVPGDARIEVLSPTLLRLEYSPSSQLREQPHRQRARPSHGGTQVPRPGDRRVADAADQRDDAALQASDRGPSPRPTRPCASPTARAAKRPIPPGTGNARSTRLCQAGAAVLGGGATLSFNQSGYQSSAGYVGNVVHRGASATWTVLGAPPGRAQLSIRYSNVSGAHSPATARTVGVIVNGGPATTVTAAPTDRRTPVVDGHDLDRAARRAPTRSSCGAQPATAATSTSTPLAVGGDRAAVPTATQTAAPRRLGAGLRHLHLRATATLRPGQRRRHVPEHLRAAAQRRPARPSRVAAARRHPERAVDGTGLGPAPPRGRGRRRRVPLRLRPGLRRGAAHVRPV